MKKPFILLIILIVVLAVVATAILLIDAPEREEQVAELNSPAATPVTMAAEETDPQDTDLTDQTTETVEPETTKRSRSVFSEDELGLIERIIFAKADGEDTGELLDALEEIDPINRAAWDEILDFWDETHEEGYVNTLEAGGTDISVIEGCPVDAAHEGTVLPEGLPADDSLCIVCLGFQLYSDGSMQDELVGRLEVIRACAVQYPNAWILLTGGPTAFQERSVTEADVMADWLVEHGVEKERILVENRSMTSATNALFTYELLRDSYPQVRDIAIISSDYHVALASQLFQAQFILARALGSDTLLNVRANASYHVDMDEEFGSDIESNWLWILVREQVTDIHNIEGEM